MKALSVGSKGPIPNCGFHWGNLEAMFPLYDLNRLPIRPVVVYSLILLNFLAFIYTYFLTDPAQVLSAYAFVPSRFFADPSGQWATLFTSMFLHGSIAHILGNMWFLWIFGDNVEARMGHGRFLVFYLLGGVIAAFFQGLIGGDAPMIGASGAISAVLGAYIVLFPRALIFSLVGFFPLPVPALIYLGYWALLQLWQSAGGVPGIAFWAHIGGFIGGALLVRFFVVPQRYRRP